MREIKGASVIISARGAAVVAMLADGHGVQYAEAVTSSEELAIERLRELSTRGTFAGRRVAGHMLALLGVEP